MKLFVRVIELGSFAAVAHELNVSRSVVSRQIQALETHLGGKLIARSTRKLSVTSAGATYLERCREILRLVDTAESNLTENRQLPRGKIRISLPFSFGLNQMMPMLEEFMAANPEISLELDFNDRKVNLIEGGFDLAIRITNHLDPGDISRKIGSSHTVVVASPDYIKHHGKPKHPNELIDHECIAYVLTTRSNWEFRIDGEMKSFPISGRLEANNGDAMIASVIRGMGITYVPTFVVEQAIRNHKLEILLTNFLVPAVGIYAVFPSNRYIPHRVSALVDHLSNQIGDKPSWDEILNLK